ncbi:hypothetical protein [Streptomyces sp. ZSW22]|uniref:hypothetical protein n=1 Tax=Streptomyces sp. ZSW22 TaxID=3055050 RepID=UPI0025AEFBA3|nr:hypothetical protein [Streptomyces sp. ZSW22]MDN3244123.1 hypothetical protein [Streptomyces sp. ZSW22]
MTIRHTVDSITSDALDALYEQLDAAEAGEPQRQLATAREALASATTRAARAEAAIARVRAALPPYTAPVHGDTSRGIQIGWDRARDAVLAALDGEQPAPEPCDGRPCTGTGCSHELAAAALTAHDHDAGLYTAPTLAATQATDVTDPSWSVQCRPPGCGARPGQRCRRWDGSEANVSCGSRWREYDRQQEAKATDQHQPLDHS